MSDKLPDFERHPLDETVLGVQFEPLQLFGIQHLFDYWNRIRERYPRIEEQIALPHAVETSTLEPRKDPKFLIAGPPTPIPLSRFWFLDASGTQLLQIQSDRLMRNWRRVDGAEAYPRFEKLFATFWKEWQGFQAFLNDEKIDLPKVDQCEVSYVNFINTDEINGGLSGMENAFTVLRQARPRGFLPLPEIQKWESSYALPEGRGRLHVAAFPNFRQRDFKLVVNLTLSARGKPADGSNDRLAAWFQMAHEWIVRGFEELTTPEMHKIWGKKT